MLLLASVLCYDCIVQSSTNQFVRKKELKAYLCNIPILCLLGDTEQESVNTEILFLIGHSSVLNGISDTKSLVVIFSLPQITLISCVCTNEIMHLNTHSTVPKIRMHVS